MRVISTIGFDIATYVFQAHGSSRTITVFLIVLPLQLAGLIFARLIGQTVVDGEGHKAAFASDRHSISSPQRDVAFSGADIFHRLDQQ